MKLSSNPDRSDHSTFRNSVMALFAIAAGCAAKPAPPTTPAQPPLYAPHADRSVTPVHGPLRSRTVGPAPEEMEEKEEDKPEE